MTYESVPTYITSILWIYLVTRILFAVYYQDCTNCNLVFKQSANKQLIDILALLVGGLVAILMNPTITLHTSPLYYYIGTGIGILVFMFGIQPYFSKSNMGLPINDMTGIAVYSAMTAGVLYANYMGGGLDHVKTSMISIVGILVGFIVLSQTLPKEKKTILVYNGDTTTMNQQVTEMTVYKVNSSITLITLILLFLFQSTSSPYIISYYGFLTGLLVSCVLIYGFYPIVYDRYQILSDSTLPESSATTEDIAPIDKLKSSVMSSSTFNQSSTSDQSTTSTTSTSKKNKKEYTLSDHLWSIFGPLLAIVVIGCLYWGYKHFSQLSQP